MRLKENYFIRKIGDEFLMISHHDSTIDFTRAITLNASAAFLIAITGHQTFSCEEWVTLLVEKYEIDRTVAEADVKVFTDKLIREELLYA